VEVIGSVGFIVAVICIG